jgi:hypothetical protein
MINCFIMNQAAKFRVDPRSVLGSHRSIFSFLCSVLWTIIVCPLFSFAYHDLGNGYGISVLQMTTDMLCLS